MEHHKPAREREVETLVPETPFFCSWSGGKDSALALFHAIELGASPRNLLTMLIETGDRSRGHGLPVSVIDSQARAMGIPLMTRNASWEGYEGQFKDALDELKKLGITHGVFGDIDLEGHREWVERVTLEKGMKAALPLWKMGRRELLAEFFAMGFEARIVSVKDGVLDKSYLGKELTPSVVSEIEAIGIDAAGENGEYHTVVTDGPMFSYPIRLDSKEIVSRDGYHFLSVIES
ncbi:MAG: diphthine--ammonia ligase [Candidatus Thermoplasmatota archaeon]|nr:diphthine--ammonia ligase [Candidatus Thermoplasmatota archaeon]